MLLVAFYHVKFLGKTAQEKLNTHITSTSTDEFYIRPSGQITATYATCLGTCIIQM